MWNVFVYFGIIFFEEATFSIACHTEFVTTGNYFLGPSDDNFWLENGPFAFNMNGKWRSTDDDSLMLQSQTHATSGVDDIGAFQESMWNLTTDDGGNMQAAVRTYPLTNLPIVVYIQRFPNGLAGAKVDSNRTITAFPSFGLQDSIGSLGYLSFGSYMLGDMNKKAGIWGSQADINHGLEGGPLALFDEVGNALVISPLDNFMAASMLLDQSTSSLNYGIMGGVNTLPAGFQSRTIAYCSNTGIGDAFEGWGAVLRKVYNKTDDVVKFYQSQDLSLTSLGYWTDNGAYYYYNKESGKNYQDTLLDAHKDWIANQIPYAYIQLDSWFYPKDANKAVTTWDATEDIFPNGIGLFHDTISLPIVAHNRFWSTETIYAKQRGGFFDFVFGKQLSVPNDQFFWEFLLGHGNAEWDLIVYEQDWLNVQFLKSEFLTSDLNLARTWLLQMGAAAGMFDMKIQYCMALPRHALQSLEIPSVTQARVSNDYHADPNQWKIGVTSHFANAIGVAPFKDTFWTTSVQPGNTYNKNELYPTLQVVAATLSRGPVGPGDMIGGTNTSILMRCCDGSGRILKPSKPARAIDDQIKEMAFTNYSGVAGELWTTFSQQGDLIYGVIMAANLSRDYTLTAQGVGFLSQFAPNFTESVIYSADNQTLTHFNATSNFTISANECTTNGEPFCLLYTAPVLVFGSQEVVLMGDLSKWVPMSEDRVKQLSTSPQGVSVSLMGKPGELLSFTFAVDSAITTNSLPADEFGCANFVIVVGTRDDANATTTSATTSSNQCMLLRQRLTKSSTF